MIATVLVFLSLAWAQTEVEVPTINIYGSQKSSVDSVPTVSELSGARLQRKRKQSLGESLSRETGVTSTSFGPAASRPVIRGQEGDRIRVLQDGTGLLDASAASQDHAVAVEPLVIEKIEIIRGPGALLYGSSAVGGVVNMTLNRIPEKLPETFYGKAEGKFTSNDMGRGGALALDGKLGQRWAVHADGAARAADDYHYSKERRVNNSFNRNGNEALGVSYIGENGFLGASFANFESSYGTIAERFVHINMQQQRAELAGELRQLGWIQSVRMKLSSGWYKHDEMENGNLGTVFKNTGYEARTELRHRPVAGFSGVFGLQTNQFDFSAQGDEKFLPSTNNKSHAIFLFEEKLEGNFRPSFGMRYEGVQVASEADPAFPAPETKTFDGLSAALGFLQELGRGYALVLNTSYTERAPNYQELFANGPHVATGIFERGLSSLKEEKSRAVELSLRHKGGMGQGSLGVFVQDYEDYIFLAPTGGTGPAPDNLPEFAFGATDARFYGAELEYRHNISHLISSGVLEFELKVDWLKGENRRTGDNLPRVTPLRETIGLNYKTEQWIWDLDIQRTEAQHDTAPLERETGDYIFVNLGAERSLGGEKLRSSIFARVNNIFDAEGRNHVSILRDVAPLPGRNFIAGLRMTF